VSAGAGLLAAGHGGAASRESCLAGPVVQQYARFKQSRIRSAVFGNSRQFFIMRQNDRADLDDMGKDIALPEVTQHAIMNYPLPDHQTGQKYSPFTYLHTDSTRNLCGTAHNIASPEMLHCWNWIVWPVSSRVFKLPIIKGHPAITP